MMNDIFVYLVILFVFPIITSTGWLSYILWYTLNTNYGVQFAITWSRKPLITFKIKNFNSNWKEIWEQSNTASLDW